MELSEKLHAAGLDVVIVARSRLLRRYFGRGLAKRLETLLEQKGVRVISGATIRGCERKGSGYDVALSNGDVVYADALVLATGVSPNLLPPFDAGDGGIPVDCNMRTAYEDVYAAGDVAAVPYISGGEKAPCPILPEAVRQGKLAGRCMAGQEQRYPGAVPANYLRVFEENLFSIGEAERQAEPDRAVLSSGDFRLFFAGEALAGVEAFGMKSVHPGVFRFLIENRVPVPEKDRQLLLEKPRETAVWLAGRFRAGGIE